jgi:hypothetical protein
MIIEQVTILVLILSRWLLPKGELSREELSQLLLVKKKRTLFNIENIFVFLGLYRYCCGYN